ncbi:MAG TPA: hypothetical protein VL172_22695 [Kofleriaceae bacterium]|jgi:hypothetical protein|nr:hypothetical protein [Kofleriaceae bacterium]
MTTRLLLLSVLVAACGGGTAAPDAEPGDAADYIDCGDLTADGMRVDMVRTGETGSRIQIMALDPDPPARFENAWIVASPDGPITAVTPWMPEHGHGAQTPAVITATGDPDQYSLDPLDLWMPGLWEVRIEVGGSDQVLFRVCIGS